MLIYSETGKTKSNEIRVTRSIGALIIGTSKSISALENERINVYIERANGTNVEILNNISLKHFLKLTTFNGVINKFIPANELNFNYALCEIANNGNIELGTNESIFISLTGLTAASAYTINAIEYPQASKNPYRFDRKTLLTDETMRDFDVVGYDYGIINLANLTEIEYTFNTGHRIKYTIDEMEIIVRDMKPIEVISTEGFESHRDTLMLPLTEASNIRLYKSTGASELTLLAHN